MQPCLDETLLHAQVFQYIVSDYLLLVEILQVEHLEILNLLRVLSSFDPQQLSQCYRVEHAKLF